MGASYSPYPEYKDSNYGWLGEIPAGWSLSRHKYIARFQKGKNPAVLLDEPSDKSIKYLSMDYLRGNSNPLFSIVEKSSYVSKDQQVLIIWDGSNAGEFVKGKVGIVSSTMAASEIILKIDKDFYWYSCICLEPEMRRHATGMGIPHVNGNELKNSVILLPSRGEQEVIANFLDHETVKIDTLIEKQQQLIKLLKEKRQAVISHAVTKGLNPNVSMRDSGVEWLGEVPSHWDFCFIKHKCAEITDGAHVSPETKDGVHHFVSITDIKKGVINFDNALKTTSRSYQYLIKTGCMPFPDDILFSKDGTIGQTAITPKGIDFVVASSLIIIRPNPEKVRSQYLNFLLQSGVVVEQVESFVKGAALRRLSIQNLLKIVGAFPPMKEQEEISSYLIKKLDKYDDLEKQANSLIVLQKERRTALISAAVTGKIDVRSWRDNDSSISQCAINA